MTDLPVSKQLFSRLKHHHLPRPQSSMNGSKQSFAWASQEQLSILIFLGTKHINPQPQTRYPGPIMHVPSKLFVR
jgi:hypothetical protein